jgi:hypothetical protein
MPRAGKSYDKLKSMSEEYDTAEFMITNTVGVFDGNAVQLMMAVYKAEQIPIRVRLYDASKAAEFELRSGNGFEETFGDDYEDRLVQMAANMRAPGSSSGGQFFAHDLMRRVGYGGRGEFDDPREQP